MWRQVNSSIRQYAFRRPRGLRQAGTGPALFQTQFALFSFVFLRFCVPSYSFAFVFLRTLSYSLSFVFLQFPLFSLHAHVGFFGQKGGGPYHRGALSYRYLESFNKLVLPSFSEFFRDQFFINFLKNAIGMASDAPAPRCWGHFRALASRGWLLRRAAGGL